MGVEDARRAVRVGDRVQMRRDLRIASAQSTGSKRASPFDPTLRSGDVSRSSGSMSAPL